MNQQTPLLLCVERRDEPGRFGIVRGGGAIGELQIVDPRLLRQEGRLVTARVDPQGTGGLAATRQCATRIVELTLIDERLHLFRYRRQGRRPAPELIVFRAELDQFIRRRFEPLRNVLFRYAPFAELYENGTQRRDLDAFVAGDLGR